MKLNLFVFSSRSNRKFLAKVHVHTSSKQFFLDPKGFYFKYGKEIPHGHHYELELLEPSTKMLRQTPIHVHASKRSPNLFVCYPRPIPTLEKAIEIFTVWCVGTVATWDFKVDLNTVHAKCKGNNRRFLKTMKRKYEIQYGVEILDII